MNPNARIYPIYVLDEVIKGDKVEVGAAGSHNDVALEIEFSANWEGLAKKIYWENANGTPGGFTLLLPSMLEPERDDVYLVPIPAQAKDAPGWMKMSIKGTKLVDGEEVLIRMSETGRFKLLKSNYNQWGGPDVGPDQATQLQDEIEKLTADVPRQIEAHNTDPEAHADIREALERHTEDWDNPHHVTAAQVHSKMTLVFTGTITAGKPVRLTVDKPFSDVLEALQKGVVVDAMYESTVLRLSSFSDYAMNFVCAPYSVKNADKFLSINFTSSDMAYGVLLDLGNSEDNIQEVFTAHITDEVGRAVCDMTASEIIDADRIGVVKAEYTDPATEEIRTYYYFKQTKDRRAVFSKDGYIEDGVAKSSLIYVDSNGYVTVETRPLRLPGGFATCDDVADSPTSASNVWYIPKTVPRPSGIPGMMLDVKWINGHVGGLGYNVTLIWGEAGGADNETIVGQSSVSGGPQDVSIPVGGTVRYQLVDSGSRMSWKYVSGSLLKKQYSTATAPDTVKKVVPGLSGGYLPGMDIYLQVDKGSTASTMTLVPDDGKTLPVYGNGKGKATGNIPTGYILHLKNAGDHWQILNQPGGSEGSEIVRYTCSDAANEAEKVQLAKTRATPPALKDTFIVSFTEGNTASTMNLHFGSAVYAVTGGLAMSPGYEAQFYVAKHDPAGLSNEVILLNPDSSVPIRELNESLDYITPEQFEESGEADDTGKIQRCLDYAAENNLNVHFPGQTYKISSTIYVRDSNNSTACHTIDFGKSTLIADKIKGTVVEVAKGADSTYAKNHYISIKNINIDGGAEPPAIGLHINAAQGVEVESMHIDKCDIGFQMTNVYYSSFVGFHIINNCRVGAKFDAGADNTINMHDCWIVGGSRVSPESFGVVIDGGMYAATLDHLTIEGYGTGIVQHTVDQAANIAINKCYFERLTKAFIVLNGSVALPHISITGCHGNETKEMLSENAIQIKRGVYDIRDNFFKDNLIEVTGVSTYVDSDMPVKEFYSPGNGWQQNIQRTITSADSIAEIYDSQQCLCRLDNKNGSPFVRYSPVYSVQMQNQYYLSGGAPVLQSPAGTLYALSVDDSGKIVTKEIYAEAYRYNVFAIKFLLAEISGLNYPEIVCLETGLHYVKKPSGEYLCSSGVASNFPVFGDTATCIDVFQKRPSNSWRSIWIYNTDAAAFWVNYGDYQVWGGQGKSDLTDIRCWGTTSQRPKLAPAHYDVLYFDTDIQKYLKWDVDNGEWVER